MQAPIKRAFDAFCEIQPIDPSLPEKHKFTIEEKHQVRNQQSVSIHHLSSALDWYNISEDVARIKTLEDAKKVLNIIIQHHIS